MREVCEDEYTPEEEPEGSITSYYGVHRRAKVAMRPAPPFGLPVNDLLGPHVKLNSWGRAMRGSRRCATE